MEDNHEMNNPGIRNDSNNHSNSNNNDNGKNRELMDKFETTNETRRTPVPVNDPFWCTLLIDISE